MKKHCFTASCLLVLSTAALTVNSASAQTNFGSLSIGHSASQSVTVNIPQGGTVSAIEVLTGGGANLDFNNAGGGSCTVGKSYVVNSSCTVEVSFQPTAPGARYGGVTLQLTGAGLPTFSTAYLEGIGLGAQTSFSPESPVLLGTIGNLSGVQSDGRGYVFYTAAGIEEGGEPVAAGSFGSFSGAEGLYGEPRIQSPSGVAIDGAGTACIFDPLVGATDIFFPTGGAQYKYSPSSICPGSAVFDGAGNAYTLQGPTKETRQADGSYVQSTVSNLDGTGVAVDGSGNVFVAAGELYKESPNVGGSYTQSVVPLNLTGITTVNVDGVGNLYLNASTGLFKETLQANGSYVQSPISIGSLSAANTKIEWSDLHGNLDLATQTDQTYFYTFYSEVSSLSYSQPPALSFASTAYEAISTDSPQIITITNSGNQPLKFSAITFPADFSESTTAANACAAGVNLAQGASCTLAVEFTPKTAGTAGTSTNLSESVLITTNALNKATEQAIQVSGTETFPSASQVTLKLSSAGVVYGGNTTASVSLSPGVAAPTMAPTGTIKLVLDGSTVIETLTLSGSGHGTAAAYGNFGGVDAGVHTIAAVYSGDANNPASTSAPVTYTVTPAPVTLTVYCPSTVLLGSGLTCQVYTSPILAGAPGVVTYEETGLPGGSVSLSGGSATVTAPPENQFGLRYTIVFSYAAQGNYGAATPVVKTFTLNVPQ